MSCSFTLTMRLASAISAYSRYQHIVRRELSAEPLPSLAARFETTSSSGPTLPREDLVPLREVTLHLVEWPGDEPTIVAIHGSAGNGHIFGALAERLAPTYRLVAPDLRGHGFSDNPQVAMISTITWGMS